MKRMIVDTGGLPLSPTDKRMLAEAGRFEYEVVEGPVRACGACGFFDCVCDVRKVHKPTCRFRRAMECPVGIACEAHNADVCPICDPCDCDSAEGIR